MISVSITTWSDINNGKYNHGIMSVMNMRVIINTKIKRWYINVPDDNNKELQHFYNIPIWTFDENDT